MEVFLPIAQVFVNPIEILLLSAIVGVLSGLFGVGGGFLMTPFLIFLGIPPAYAVANEANNILATSVSGSTTHYLKNTLDYKMGSMIVIGGVIGTSLGIYTFTYFKGIGKIDTVISLAYMYILAILGTLMLIQGVSEIDKARKKIVVRKKLHTHYWIHGLPFRMRFKKSKVYESAFTPIIIGLIVGYIAAIMGVGGAFILVPAMIYIIGMPTKLIPGTSLFVTIFVSAIVTVLHAFNYGTIDLVLVFVLILGSIIGVQFGQKIGENIVIRRKFNVSSPFVYSYIHGNKKIGVLVSLKQENEELGKDLAMHVAASNPLAISPEEISEEIINKEKEIIEAQVSDADKPQEIIEKMTSGRLKKFLSEVSLIDQPFVKDPSLNVSQLLKNNDNSVLSFIRYEVGEGIEVEKKDFAEEVQAQLGN